MRPKIAKENKREIIIGVKSNATTKAKIEYISEREGKATIFSIMDILISRWLGYLAITILAAIGMLTVIYAVYKVFKKIIWFIKYRIINPEKGKQLDMFK